MERSRAWCLSVNAPFYRLNPPLTQEVDLAETEDEILVRMLWETQAYVCREREKIKELAIRLCRKATRTRDGAC